MVAAHIAWSVFLPMAAVAAGPSDECRDVQRSIDGEVASTADLGALIRLAPFMSSTALPALFARTKAAEEEEAFSAFLGIGLSRHAEALRLLRDAPRPKSATVRLARSLALLALGDGVETSTISRLLYEGTVGERRRVSEALTRMRQKRPQLMLYEALNDPDELVRLHAARFLIRSGSVRARRALTDLLKGGSTLALKNRAAAALVRAGHSFRPEESAVLSPAHKLQVVILDATRGRKTNLRVLSGQIRSNDQVARASAFAAIALTGIETPAQLKKLERTLTPKNADASAAAPEALAALSLLAEPVSMKALEAIDRSSAERVLAVLWAFSAAGPNRAQLDSEHAGQLARVVEGWLARDVLDDPLASRAIRTMERFDPLSGLLVARAKLGGLEGKSLRTAVRVIGRSGSHGDLGALLELARRGSPSTRSEALRAAARVCAR